MPTVAASVDLVVHLDLEADGVRRVREVVAVPGRVEGDVIETETLFERRGGRLVCAGGRPPRREAFARAGLDLDLLLGERA